MIAVGQDEHPLGVIAGAGDLPVRIAHGARAGGRRVYVIALSGFADPALLQMFPGEEVGMGELGRQMRLLREAGCTELVLAGAVQRPDFDRLRIDWGGVQLLPSVIAAARRGDDALLRVLVEGFERAGFRVVGAEEVLGALLSQPGPIGVVRPSAEDWLDIRRAAQAAAMIGTLDIGQGAVSCRGVVLALEAQEGTDAMLRRCAGLRPELRGGPGSRCGVLVKRPKPQQERRIDLPTIGVATIEGACAAGLAGVAVEAGGSLLVDREAIARLADAHGLFVYGFDPAELAGDEP